MKDLNDKFTRGELIKRYLNADTTLEEERQLREYLAQTDKGLTPEEQDVRLMILGLPHFSDSFEISNAKAVEFDKMMTKKRASNVVFYWIASVAAVALFILAFTLSKRNADNQQTTSDNMTASVVAAPVAPNHPIKPVVSKRSQKVITPKKSMTVVGRHRGGHYTRTKEIEKTPNGDNIQRVNDIVSATNFKNEAVESYSLQPVGDAAIVTKTFTDGSSSTYIVSSTTDGEGLRIIALR